MAERFEILLSWAKEKKQEEEKNRFIFRKWLRKVLEQSQSTLERDWIKNKIGLQINFNLRNCCFVSDITSPIKKC